jgi:hypothetical protein
MLNPAWPATTSGTGSTRAFHNRRTSSPWSSRTELTIGGNRHFLASMSSHALSTSLQLVFSSTASSCQGYVVLFRCQPEPPLEGGKISVSNNATSTLPQYFCAVHSLSPTKDVRTSMPARIQYDMLRVFRIAKELQLRNHFQWIYGTQICQWTQETTFTDSSPCPCPGHKAAINTLALLV